MQSEGNIIAALIDGETAFGAAAEAIKGARRRVRLLQMTLEPDFVPRFDLGTNPSLVDMLRAAGERGVETRVLLSKTEPVDILGYADAERALAACPNVMVHAFPLRAKLQHSKVMIVDDELAFVFGSLFTQPFWDQADHAILEHRRAGAIPSVGPRPVHDVTIRVEGPAVADVDRCFVDLWNHQASVEERPQDVIESCSPPRPVGQQAVQVVRTLPRGLLADRPEGETDIYEAYLRGIGNARRLIYLENQYLTSPPLADALRWAVERAPDLEVILLLNSRLDIPLYLKQQRSLLDGPLHHPRIAVFSPWAFESRREPPALQRTYIHSKSAIIDDCWSALGTANLDGFSLHGASEFGMPDGRNVECDLIALDAIAGKPATGFVQDLRRRLWAEHLGAARVPSEPPAGSWLAVWRAIADENIESLRAGQGPSTLVLPFPTRSRRRDAEDLRELGIDPSRLDLHK